ncbi:MAG: hypothetical protein JXN65_11985 [Clostridia bacterium]|nr:hypothetical protein [Clostridia bacterium]
MNKKFVIKTLTTVSIILVSAIAVLAVALFFASDEAIIKGFAVGLGLGALVGGLIKSIVVIPKKYREKDERALLVTLLSNLISQSVFGLSSYLCIMLLLTGLIAVNVFDIPLILISVGIIAALTFISEKVAYVIIDKKM